MMRPLLTVLAAGLSSVVCFAEPLARLDIENWLSYHAVYKGRYHAIGVDLDGSLDLFSMSRDAKLYPNYPVTLRMKIERREKDSGEGVGEWVSKRVQLDGFIAPPEPTENPSKYMIHGMITGDVEFQLEFAFARESVAVNASLVGEPKDAATAEYRVSLVSKVENISTVTNEEDGDAKKIKGKTKNHDVAITTRRTSRPQKVGFYEVIETEKLAEEGIVSLKLRSKKIGKKSITWSLADAKKGSLEIIPAASSKMPHKGFTVTTMLVDEAGEAKSAGMVLAYK